MFELIQLLVGIIVLFTILNNYDTFLKIVQNLTLGLLNLFAKLSDKFNPPQ